MEALAQSVARQTNPLWTAAEIGLKAGKVIGRYRMAKHFALAIHDGHLGWTRKADSIRQEELLSRSALPGSPGARHDPHSLVSTLRFAAVFSGDRASAGLIAPFGSGR